MSNPFGWLAAAVLLCATGSHAVATVETAKRADDFADSIGVNTHYGNAGNGPGNAYSYPALDAKLGELGVRHIRDHTHSDVGLPRIDGLFANYGVRANLILGETSRSPATLVNILKQHPAYEAIEGLNEPDLFIRSYNGQTDNPSTNQYPATKAFQNELYNAVKADPQTNHITVLSPAMSRAVESQYLIPIGFDVAAVHSYAWSTSGLTSHPPSAGVDTRIGNMAALRGSKPLWCTETGYFNRSSTDTRRVPESVSAKYIPRTFGEYFNRGIERTYLYELADQGPSTTSREENFGLVRFDMTEKPAFVAMKNMIDLLEEPAAPDFTPDSLDYTLTLNGGGSLSNVHHTLLQKSDNTFYLMLWQEVGSFDRPSQTIINNPAMSVTLSLATPMNAETFLPGTSTSPTATQLNTTSINLSVPDEVLIVELSAIPEPGTLGLLGVTWFAAMSRRHRRRAPTGVNAVFV
jgi:hypothetical protein